MPGGFAPDQERQMSHYGYETGRESPNKVQRLAEAFLAYLRSRTMDHWIMFFAGLALGALIG
jgi:hypothetical protein